MTDSQHQDSGMLFLSIRCNRKAWWSEGWGSIVKLSRRKSEYISPELYWKTKHNYSQISEGTHKLENICLPQWHNQHVFSSGKERSPSSERICSIWRQKCRTQVICLNIHLLCIISHERDVFSTSSCFARVVEMKQITTLYKSQYTLFSLFTCFVLASLQCS